MTNLWNDIRYALRQLRKAPGFALTAVLTLALGIGISAAMFAVVDGVLLRPLPVPHSSQIVAISSPGNNGVGRDPISLPDARDWRAQSKSFQGIAWYTQSFFNLKKQDGSIDFSINTQAAPNFFSTLQVAPWMGRTFVPQDAYGGQSNVAVLSYYVWANYFSRDPAILGKNVQLGANAYTVIGVMPKHFYIPINNDGPVVWTLLAPDPTMEQRDNSFLNLIGRLRPGVTLAAANAELDGIQGNIARQYASLGLAKRVSVKDYRETQVGSVRPALLALQGAVLLVWLIACANVAGLLLTRLSARRREIAVRAALGAGRARIVQQFLTESLLLSFTSALIGLGIAKGCLVLLHTAIESNLNRANNVALNWQVILLLIGLSILSAVIFGAAPALQAASADPQEALHQGTLTAGSGLGQIRLRNLLIVSELALSLVLLFSAGLLLRTIYALHTVNLHFDQHNLIDAQFFPMSGFVVPENAKTPPVMDTLYRPLLERTRHLAGVESADLTMAAPLSSNVRMNDGFFVLGSAERKHHASFAGVTPGIFHTLRTRLIAGRLFDDRDRKDSPAVCIVNRAFERAYLPGKNVLDQRLDLDTTVKEKTIFHNTRIVGVVADAPGGNVGESAAPEVYVDVNQVAQSDPLYPIMALAMELVVRTHQPAKTVVPEIRRIFSEVDPNLSINYIQTYRQKIDGELGSQALAARLLWIFAIAAVLISAAGLYGLLSYSVSQRTREIGVRIALGAQREDILRVILRQAGKLVITGIVIGLFCAFFLGRFVQSFLYGVTQHDALTLAVVAGLLGLVALVAAYIPARRASRIEPTEALRTE